MDQDKSDTVYNISNNISDANINHISNGPVEHVHPPPTTPSRSTKRQKTLSTYSISEDTDEEKDEEECQEVTPIPRNAEELVVDDRSVKLPSGTTLSDIVNRLPSSESLRSHIVCVDYNEAQKVFGQDQGHVMAWFKKPAVESEFQSFLDKMQQVADDSDPDSAVHDLQSLSSEVSSPHGPWAKLGGITQRWLATALNTLLDRWQHKDLNAIDKGEGWYTCALWARIFDDGVRAISSDIGINRGEITDNATAARYNMNRSLDNGKKQASGKRQDEIIEIVAGVELGAHEACIRQRDFDTKVLDDGLKIKRTLKDMLWQLQDQVRRYPPLVRQLSVIGILTRPKECTIMHMMSKGNVAFIQQSKYHVPTTYGRIHEFLQLLLAVREIAKVAITTHEVIENPRKKLSPEQWKEFKELADERHWPAQVISPCKPTPPKPPKASTQKPGTK